MPFGAANWFKTRRRGVGGVDRLFFIDCVYFAGCSWMQWHVLCYFGSPSFASIKKQHSHKKQSVASTKGTLTTFNPGLIRGFLKLVDEKTKLSFFGSVARVRF